MAEPVAPPERIEIGDIVLRRWDLAWAEELQAAVMASLPELAPFMPWANEQHGLDQSTGYLTRSTSEWDDGKAWNYAICVADDVIVGSAGLMTRMGPGVLEIGYWVHSGYAGRGYATAATRALAEVGLDLADIERIAVRHDVANPASGRVAAKAGFVQVREIETEVEAPGQTGHELVWELTR